MTKKAPSAVLLASHGTEGARAAERSALARLKRGERLVHLFVVPDFWKGMMGDDWLNNASTRDIYARFVETSLEGEAQTHAKRLAREAKRRGLRYDFELAFGRPAECLVARLKRGDIALVVLGAPRPKGRTGLRSRMLNDDLLRALPVPALIAPYPHGRR
jgi:nucleotide-binding universal stress UspA family protein